MSLARGGKALSPRIASWTVAAVVALGLAALAPIGLASGEAADLAATAFGVGRPVAESHPLAELLSRAAALVPIGEVGTRPHAVAALAAVIALVFLLALLSSGIGRVRSQEAIPAQPPRAAPEGKRGARGKGGESGNRGNGGKLALLSAAVGLSLVAVSRPFVEMATVRPGAAVDFALFVGILVLFETVRRDPARSSSGLGLAFLCGLAAGAGWPVRAVLWPVAGAVTIWALRRGERWPLLAPTLFVGAGGVALAGVIPATVEPPVTLGFWLHHILVPATGPASGVATGVATNLATFLATTLATSATTLSLVIDDVGVLAVLAVTVGCWSLLWTRNAEAIPYVGLSLAVAATSLSNGDVLFCRLCLITASAFPVTRGHAALAHPFGRARGAVAIVLGVLVVLWPAVVGVGSALGAPGRRVPGDVARRLDAVAGAPRSAFHALRDAPSDREAARWWRYAQILDPR